VPNFQKLGQTSSPLRYVEINLNMKIKMKKPENKRDFNPDILEKNKNFNGYISIQFI
jgi:hypothetical protein